MAGTLQDLKDAFAALVAKVGDMKTSVDADLAQTASVLTAVNNLIAAIQASGNTNFDELIAQVKASTSDLEATRAKLSSDNADVDAAIVAAGQVTPPPQA